MSWLVALEPFVGEENWEEVRFRIGQAVEVITARHVRFVPATITVKWLEQWLLAATDYSLYAHHLQLQQGYITTKEGYRLGIAGQVVVERGVVSGFKTITSVVVRRGQRPTLAVAPLLNALREQRWPSLLIAGLPRSGKTTLVCSLVEQLSAQFAKRIVVIDERQELVVSGRTIDRLAGCSKAVGVTHALRSLSPEYVVVDELGDEHDRKALEEMMYAGVSVIATIHGRAIAEWRHRTVIRDIATFPLIVQLIELERRAVLYREGKEVDVWSLSPSLAH